MLVTIRQTRKIVFNHISKHRKGVENTTRSEVFLRTSRCLVNVIKHSPECLMYLKFSIKNYGENAEIKSQNLILTNIRHSNTFTVVIFFVLT